MNSNELGDKLLAKIEKNLPFLYKNKYNENLVMWVTCTMLLVLTLSTFVYFDNKNNPLYGFKCADKFNSSEEYLNSLTQWIMLYLEKNPQASKQEIFNYRTKLKERFDCGQPSFYIDLQEEDNVEEDKNDPELMREINNEIIKQI